MRGIEGKMDETYRVYDEFIFTDDNNADEALSELLCCFNDVVN